MKKLHNLANSQFSKLNSLIKVSCILLCVMFTHSVFSNDFFWANPQSRIDYSFMAQKNGNAYEVSSFSNANNDFHYDQTKQSQAYSSLSVTRYFNNNDNARGGSALHLQYANKDEQEGVVLGFTQNNLSVSYMNGSGQNYAKLTDSFAGIDPFSFHGGLNHKFDFSGFAVNYSVNKIGQLQFGQAEVQSNFLQNRKAQYFEWSNDYAFARATEFSRGSEKIGHGFDAGFQLSKRGRLAFQAMRLDAGKRLNRVRFKLDGQRGREYWLDVSSLNNDLYLGNNDIRFMMHFKTVLSQNSAYNAVSNSKSEVEVDGGDPKNNSKTKKKGVHRGVYIGLGVAAGAVLASSGSSDSDGAARLRTQDEAAFEVLNNINPVSVRENREHGGWVYRNLDGSFSFTDPVGGDSSSVRLPSRASVIPAGSISTASYHTHAAFDPRFDNENFSPTDLESDISAGVDGYLGTPAGAFKFHNHRTGEITTLGRIAN